MTPLAVSEEPADDLTVSAAVCTYQGTPHVETQVESILDQTRPPDELVVCDDGSTDGTQDAVREAAEGHDATLRLVENDETLGVKENKAKAIRLAEGDVVFLADQDDRWHRDRVETMLERFRDPSVGLVYSDARIMGPDLEAAHGTRFQRFARYGLHRERSAWEIIRPQTIRVLGCTMALRTALRPLLLPMPRHGAHDYWIFFLANAVTRAVPVDEPLMDYRRHEGGAGFDLNEGGRVTGWIRRARNWTRDEYQGQRHKWEEAHERLADLDPDDLDLPVDDAALREHREASAGARDLAAFRERMVEQPRRRRLVPSVRRLASGDYHRYHLGLKTALADLVISPGTEPV